ncbi:MAG: hypothetical protein ISQ06_09165, partial [Planctomycetaceae bacterium]|nr:hypothetical protein [Planctomycetaceae bacterium]
VSHLSFLKDVSIIVKTVAVVLLGEERFLKKPDTQSEPLPETETVVIAPDNKNQSRAA